MSRRGALTLLLGAALALGPVLPAAAATPGLELSSDGVSYSSGLPAALFDSLPHLVPLQQQSRTFWVRNATATDAYLTLMLDSPTWTSETYGAALSVATSVPDRSGAAVTLASAADCAVLLDGWVLGAGQSVAVTATLALGDLAGVIGQTADASLDIGVTLTEVAGLDAPDSCATSSSPGTPSGPAVPGAVVPVVAAHHAAAPAAVVEPAPESPPTVVPGSPLGPLGPLALVLANTLGSFDGSLVGWAAIAVPAGAAVFFLLGLRRRGIDDEQSEEGI